LADSATRNHFRKGKNIAMWKSGKYGALALVGAGLAVAANAPALAHGYKYGYHYGYKHGYYGYGGAGYHRYGPRAEAEVPESFISRARRGRLGEVIGRDCLQSWVNEPQWTWKCAGYALSAVKTSINYHFGVPIDEPRFSRAFIAYYLGLGPDPLGVSAARHRPHFGLYGRHHGPYYGRM
jgi:hypothetical protein